MKALLQRVSSAAVDVAGERVAQIDRGLLVLLGLDRGDDFATGERLLEKLLAYRVFPDAHGRMNCSVRDIEGSILLVSQFTLSADTRKGLRPSFTAALAPDLAEPLYAKLLQSLQQRYPKVGAGVFGADMQVSLVNDGPVTFLLELTPD